MKKVLAIVALVGFVSLANAQSKGDKSFTFGVGPVVSIPTGDFGTSYGVGFGAELQGVLSLSSSFEGFAQVGYTTFSGKSISIFGTTFKPDNVGFLPVLVGGRYNAGGLVAGLGLGYGSFSGGGSSSGGFAFSPQAGYSSEKIEFLAHYTSVSTDGSSSGFFGVKAFYKF